MIKFKSIKAVNFLSTGQKSVELDLTSKSTIISGNNGNGKSIILDAITYALYNKAYRKIKLHQLINYINKKKSLVTIELSISGINYKIERGQKPIIFKIYKDSEYIKSPAKGYQSMLEEILGMNEKTFRQIVILGSASFVPFMELDIGNRRKMIEDLLDLEIFTRMNVINKKIISDNKKKLVGIGFKITSLSEKIQQQQGYIDDINSKDADRKGKIVKEIQGYVDRKKVHEIALKGLTDDISVISMDKELYKSLSIELPNIKNKASSLINEIKKNKTELSFYKNNSKCHECEQVIDTSFKNKKIKDIKDIISTTTDKIQNKKLDYIDTHEKLQELNDVLSLINKKSNEISIINNDISILDKYITKLIDEHRSIDDDENTDDYVSSLNVLKNEYKDKNSIKLDIDTAQSQHGVIYELLKDSGIKRIIVKKYIVVLNKLITNYLQSMDFNVIFTLDDEFNEVIQNRNMQGCTYHSFSEGEKLRINVAILLAWRDIAKMKNNASTNLLILDEVFDSSLDGEGIELFNKLFDTLVDTNIVVISHRNDGDTDHFTKAINVKKIARFTKYIEV